MSFILDALKKSDSERQRQAGPALFEVKVAPPRARFPPWAIALAALLAVNLIVLAWVMTRRAEPPVTTIQPPPAAAPVGVAPATMTTAPPAQPVAPVARPLTEPSVGTAVDEAADPVLDTEAALDETSVNAADYEPATLEAQRSRGSAAQAAADVIPTRDALPANVATGLPELRIDLHVYAAKPADRFVLLNMRRMREGDATAEGVRIDSITQDGAVLSFRGTQFSLPRE